MPLARFINLSEFVSFIYGFLRTVVTLVELRVAFKYMVNALVHNQGINSKKWSQLARRCSHNQPDTE